MCSEEFVRIVDELSQDVMLAEPTDLQALASLTGHFEEVKEWANRESDDELFHAMEATRALIEQIIFEEVSDSEASMGVIRRVAQSLQEYTRGGGVKSAGMDFPVELGVGADIPDTGTGVGASEGDAAGIQDAAAASPSPPVAPVELPPPFNPAEGDLELLEDFVNEANDHLENADVSMLALESTPDDEESVNTLFRAFHTIKGVAGFLALDQILSLAHETENLLDKGRKGDLVLAGAPIDVTFEAADMMKRLIANLRDALGSGGLVYADPDVPKLQARILQIHENPGAGADVSSADVEDVGEPTEKLGTILVESGAVSEEAVSRALAQQEQPTQTPKVGEILAQSSSTSRKDVERAITAQSACGGDTKIGEILVSMGAASEEDITKSVQKQAAPMEKPKVGEILVRSGAVGAKEVVDALRTQKASARTSANKLREVVKVDADRLDRLVDMIGELVIAQSMAMQSPEIKTNGSPVFQRQLGQLDKITRQLQETGMSLRMVPLRSTFQKMARLVRDLAKKSGKAVECELAGEDTELDKTVVDKIGDPLVHMIRNSADHGIESSKEDRIASGKPATGRISLRAFHQEGNLVIEIEDDGRGLDRDRILEKALEKGLIKEGDTLADKDVWALIFEPGFSTAKVVTDVSGRGVGMDVVRRNIDALRGKIDIESRKGVGTTFSIRLPLTLAIIDGMVIRVGEERYVLPTLSIIQSVRPKPGEVTRVLGEGEMLNLQNELIPLVRLSRAFAVSSATNNAYEGVVVIVDNNGEHLGFVVDELLGQQQIVIKPLGRYLHDVSGFSGAAIMPDGVISLIVDIGGVVTLAKESGKKESQKHPEALAGVAS